MDLPTATALALSVLSSGIACTRSDAHHDVLLIALASGLVFAGRSDTARGRNAAIVLALMAANYGLRGAAHERALNLAPHLFGSRLPARCGWSAPSSRAIVNRWPRPVPPSPAGSEQGSCLVEIAALPTFVTPFDWRLVAQLSDGYEITDVNVLASLVRVSTPKSDTPSRATRRLPNQWTPAVFTAAGPKSAGCSGFRDSAARAR
jgi:hypothetical protein